MSEALMKHYKKIKKIIIKLQHRPLEVKWLNVLGEVKSAAEFI